MIVIKVAFLTCVFWMIFAVLLQAGLLLATNRTGGVFIGGKLLVDILAVMWSVSFGLAWYIVSATISATSTFRN